MTEKILFFIITLAIGTWVLWRLELMARNRKIHEENMRFLDDLADYGRMCEKHGKGSPLAIAKLVALRVRQGKIPDVFCIASLTTQRRMLAALVARLELNPKKVEKALFLFNHGDETI